MMTSVRKSQRRIILSDDEDGNEADRDDDLLDTPANKLAENMNTLSMNSADKAVHNVLSGGSEKQAVNIRNKIYKGKLSSSDEEEAKFQEIDASQNRSNNKHSPMQIIMIDDSSDHSSNAVDPLVARRIMQGSSSSDVEDNYFPPSATTPEGRGKRQSAQIATEKLKSLYYNATNPTSAEEDNNSVIPSDGSPGGEDDENNSMIALNCKNRRSNASLTSMSSIGSRHGRTPPPPSSSSLRSITPASPIAPRTRQSNRTKSISSKQDRRRLSAEEEFQRLKSKGLDGVLDDNESSEEEYNENQFSSEVDANSEEGDAPDDISQKPVIPSNKKQSSTSKDDGEKSLKYYNTVYTEQHKAARKTSAGTSSQSIVKKCIKYLAEENRGYREEADTRGNDGDEYSDINDFIVDDEEVVAEEEAIRKEKPSKKKSQSTTGKKQTQMMSEEEEPQEKVDESEEEEAFNAPKSKKRSAMNSSFSKSARKQSSKLASSGEEEEENADTMLEDENEDEYNPRKRSRNRKVQRKELTDEDEEEEEDEEESLDGPLLYYKLNAMREEEEETRWKASRYRKDNDESDPEGVQGDSADDFQGTSIFMTGRQSFPLPRAFKYYIEFLGKCILLPTFVTEFQQLTAPERSMLEKKKSSNIPEYTALDKKRVPLYQSATRQIENLICTTRESLLGSSAWKAQFLSSLQSRPFYLARCRPSSSSGGGGRNKQSDFDGERCEACGRGAQCPDHVVYLFGPTYASMQLWDVKKWFTVMPEGIFLSTSTLSNEMNGSKARKQASTTSSSSSPAGTTSTSSQQNKQFRAFQRSQDKGENMLTSPTSTTVFPSSISSKKRSSTITSNGSSSSTAVTMMDDENGECGKRKRVIFISEDEDNGGNSMKSQGNKGKKSPDMVTTTAISTPTLPAKRQKFENSMDGDDEDEGEEDSNEEDKDNRMHGKKEMVVKDKQIQWWEKKLPKRIHREKEDSYHLAVHCKNRTQLYHTLLHYKFRLILKIREYFEKDDVYGRDLEDIPHPLLLQRLETMLSDGKFISQEVARFQSLLNTSGRQYGGDKYELRDIWYEEHDTITPVRRKSSSVTHTSSGGNSGGTTLSFVTKATPPSSHKPKTQASLTQFFKLK